MLRNGERESWVDGYTILWSIGIVRGIGIVLDGSIELWIFKLV